MNSVVISGNVVANPEARTTQSGVSVSTFRVAVQRRFKNAQGQHDADFLTVVAWRGTADFCNKYIQKGSKVIVEGSIQTRSYDAQDGSKRWVTEIMADQVESLNRVENGGQSAPAKPQSAPKQSPNEGFVEVDDDSELPF